MALTITVQISDNEEKVLLNDLLDINDWFQKAKEGKVNKGKGRIIDQVVRENPDNVNVNGPDIVKGFLNRPGHKNRAQRENQ